MSDVHALMEDASRKLVEMDYLACEARCLEALALARSAGDWRAYARIVMPLQEARRQRRMIAADAVIQLGTAQGYEPTDAGCVVVTSPNCANCATRWLNEAKTRGLHREVLLAEGDPAGPRWTLRSFAGPAVSVAVEAPPSELRNHPLPPDDDRGTGTTPRHWFVRASEALGDAALAKVEAPLGTLERVEQLEEVIVACGDHELLHQALFDAAGALAKQQPTAHAARVGA